MEQLVHRAASVPQNGNGPSTLDREARSVELVVSTEAPVPMYDYARGEVVPEVLLARGARFPKQVPLLDTHDRGEVASVLGSVRELRVVGDQVVGRAVFSSIAKAQEAFTQYAEGHLTDFSAGYLYSPNDVRHVPNGEEAEIGGRTWRGPVNVVVGWTLKEASAVPIGADPAAKARAETLVQPEPQKETVVEEKKGLSAIEEARALEAEKTRRENEAREAAIKAERARMTEIRGIGTTWNLGDQWVDDHVRHGSTVDEARKDAMAQIEQRAKTEAVGRAAPLGGIHVGREDREKTREIAEKGLFFRCGTRVEGYSPHDNEYATMTLMDLVKDRLRAYNRETRGSAEDIFRRAMTDSDMPQLLANVQNKYLYDGWQEAPVTWPVWCDVASIPDYKAAQFPRIGAFPTLSSVNANKGEYTYASLADETESATIAHYGNIIGLSLKLIVNDDLGALSRIPRLQGEAAARTVESAVFNTTLMGTDGAGETMGDSNALLSSAHANWVGSGSGGAPSLTTLNVLAGYMAIQKDAGSNAYVGGEPRFILAHPSFRATVDNILVTTTPTQIGNAAGTAVYNPWANLVPIYSPYLTVNTNKVWYIAGPKGKTVTVFGLNGAPRPMLEDQKSWSTAGWEYKVTLDFVTKALDWRFVAGNYGS